MSRERFDSSHYDYYLPECDIAQEPVTPRDSSRLLTLDPASSPGSPRGMGHTVFSALDRLLRPGDCLVLNRTEVRRARLRGFRLPGGGTAEILLLEVDGARARATIRPARRIHRGTRIRIPAPGVYRSLASREAGCRLSLLPPGCPTLRVLSDEGDGIFEFEVEGDVSIEDLEALGELPLPPYILRPPEDVSGYQTVYANEPGSAAAPTAGLHFTPRLLARLRARGIALPRVVLHVGLDTFRPMREGDVRGHQMHTEWLEVSRDAVAEIRRAQARGGRIIAVGTTSVRALESASRGGSLEPFCGTTDLFIYPGYRFRTVEGLVTNFHLPRSTLLLLVSALAGRDHILAAYREARRRRYRFYSFGDAMYIMPPDGEGLVP